MSNTHITKNYFAHGGDELVIGGKLTILEGAVVENASEEGSFDGDGGMLPAAYVPDSQATTIAGLKEDFNALLAALRASGLMGAYQPPNAS